MHLCIYFYCDLIHFFKYPLAVSQGWYDFGNCQQIVFRQHVINLLISTVSYSRFILFIFIIIEPLTSKFQSIQQNVFDADIISVILETTLKEKTVGILDIQKFPEKQHLIYFVSCILITVVLNNNFMIMTINVLKSNHELQFYKAASTLNRQ